MARVALFLALLALWCCAVTAASIYVSSDASGTQDGSKSSPYGSFAAALASDSLAVGDEIRAYPGTYTGDDNYNLEIADDLSLSFIMYGDGVVEIDFGNGSDRFLKVHNSHGLPFSVTNFTFMNQAANSSNPILDFKKTEETLVDACSFKNVGFAVSMVEVSKVEVQDSSFESCISYQQNGPALYLENSIGSVTDSNFDNNRGGEGGAIYIDYGSIEMHNVQIDNSVAEKDGGGLFVGNGNVSLYDSGFNGNSAKAGSGGGIYASSPISIYTTTIENNIATLVGGGIAIETGISNTSNALNSILSDVTVYNNTASVGGGIHTYSLSPVFIKQTFFDLNSAAVSVDGSSESGCGGGLFVDKGGDSVTIDASNFSGNIAEARGGGVYISGPSGSVLFQMRSGSKVENNTAAQSGGGIELGNPVLFASFVDVEVLSNSAEDGEGGGLMLRGTCEVFNSTVKENRAYDGAGIEIDHAGFVALVDTIVTSNVAQQFGGGLHVGLTSGLLVKGSQFTANEAATGGGAYLGPSLPIEFSTSAFADNIANNGAAVYLLGTYQDGATGLNLVKFRDCDIRPGATQAQEVYSSEGEIVFIDTCTINQITANGGSISICDCPEYAVVSNLYLEGGSLLVDTTVRVSQLLNWYTGDIYGVDSSVCHSGLGGLTDSYTVDYPREIAVDYRATFGSSSTTLVSKEIKWSIDGEVTLKAKNLTTNQEIFINGGEISVDDNGYVGVTEIWNDGKLILSKSCVVDGTLTQIDNGELEIRYNGVPKSEDVVQITRVNNGGFLYVTASSSESPKKGDSFEIIQWSSYSGSFNRFELSSDTSSWAHNIHPFLDYKIRNLEIVFGKGTGVGGMIAIIVVSLLIIAAFVAGCVLTYRYRKQAEQEVWDEGTEESKILGGEPVTRGESGTYVNSRESGEWASPEDNHLIKDSNL